MPTKKLVFVSNAKGSLIARCRLVRLSVHRSVVTRRNSLKQHPLRPTEYPIGGCSVGCTKVAIRLSRENISSASDETSKLASYSESRFRSGGTSVFPSYRRASGRKTANQKSKNCATGGPKILMPAKAGHTTARRSSTGPASEDVLSKHGVQRKPRQAKGPITRSDQGMTVLSPSPLLENLIILRRLTTEERYTKSAKRLGETLKAGLNSRRKY